MLSRGIEYKNNNVLWLIGLCGAIYAISLVLGVFFAWCLRDDEKQVHEDEEDDDEDDNHSLQSVIKLRESPEFPLIRRQPKRQVKHKMDYSTL